jgi:hypothetical protein
VSDREPLSTIYFAGGVNQDVRGTVDEVAEKLGRGAAGSSGLNKLENGAGQALYVNRDQVLYVI